MSFDMVAGKRHFYIVGIKGVGMTALAQVLQARGHQVEGSDVPESFFTDAVLSQHSIPVHEGFSPSNLPASLDAVIYSTAYRADEHPELLEAGRRAIPLFTYPDVLASLIRSYETVAVAGSHGKTTTTALVGSLLAAANVDPTVIVGSAVQTFGGNARIGHSKLLAVETDEYQNKLQLYQPQHIILTNVEYDHPDFFPTPQEYVQTFQNFLQRLPKEGTLIMCGDDPQSIVLMQNLTRSVLTFGQTAGLDYQLQTSAWQDDHQAFTLSHLGQQHDFRLHLPGRHNALNALAAIAFARTLQIPWLSLQRSVEAFGTIKRRFEVQQEYHGAVIIDDYAHHPGELKATIEAARNRYPARRIIAVFQPHTYSRTKALLNEFAAALTADLNVVLEVYPSARETKATVSSQDIVRAISQPSTWLPGIDEAVVELQKMVKPSDVVLLLGAGDIWRIAGLLHKNSWN